MGHAASMGLSFSREANPSVVLCPPLFERDLKGRDRLARSSFDTLFCKPQLQWLFSDYMQPGVQSVLHFAPPDDPRVSLTAQFSAALDSDKLRPAGPTAGAGAMPRIARASLRLFQRLGAKPLDLVLSPVAAHHMLPFITKLGQAGLCLCPQAWRRCAFKETSLIPARSLRS